MDLSVSSRVVEVIRRNSDAPYDEFESVVDHRTSINPSRPG